MKSIVVQCLRVCTVAVAVGIFGCGGGMETGVPTDLTPGIPADKMPKLTPMVPGKAPSEAAPTPGKPASDPAKTPAP
jgi:hypothetical protein